MPRVQRFRKLFSDLLHAPAAPTFPDRSNAYRCTMMAGTLYRLLALDIVRCHERQCARQLFESFVRSIATIRILPEQIEMRLGPTIPC